MAAGRLTSIRSARAFAVVLGLLLAFAGILAASAPGHAALQKPLYTAGDRWVYVLQGSLGGLPGMNASQGDTFQLGLTGIVEVDVVGPASTPAGGVRVETHASGFLNGTFALLGNTTIGVSGTFSSDGSEVWEGSDYLPVASNTSSGYVVDVTILFVTTQVTANLWANATTTYDSFPPFNLSVSDSASAPFTSEVTAATSVSFFGSSQTMENRTSVAGTWVRQVLRQENVTVEAGTFSSYRLNESLGGFPGIAAVAPASGANETAWFSNDVGYYVKRIAYVNGSPAAEMRLKSYTYPASASGLTLLDVVLIIAVPVAVFALLLAVAFRRRKARRSAAKGSSGAGPVGELPPKEPGGNE